MVWSMRDVPRRRSDARHRWDALFPAEPGAGSPLLDVDSGTATHTAPLPIVDAAVPEDTAAADGSAGERSRPRFSLSVRLAVVIVLLLAVSSAGWWWVAASARPDIRSVALEEERSAGGADPPPAEASQGATLMSGELTVHVAGAVAAPGVYRLREGARVHEAIAAAGGATSEADVHRLNLAAPVKDGDRLKVPHAGEEDDSPIGGASRSGTASMGAAPGGGAAAGGGGAVGTVNINTATLQELETLPRVGPVMAQRILDYRTSHGRFKAPEDLAAVSGIGAKMLESLLPLVTVR